MKKFLSLLLAALLVLSLTACAADAPATDPTQAPGTNDAPVTGEDETTGDETQADDTATDDTAAAETAVDVLNKIWALYAEDQKFPVGGGDADNMVMDGPGAFSTEQAEALDSTAGLPQAEIAKVADAATMLHMMNANTFTGAAYHVAEGTDIAALCTAIEAQIDNRQWMCGFPEGLLIYTVNDTVVTAFGAADLLDVFETNLKAAYANASLVVDKPIE